MTLDPRPQNLIRFKVLNPKPLTLNPQVFKSRDPKLQQQHLETLKKQYVFFHYKDNLKSLMETCASFWNEPGSKPSGDILDSLPTAFPLADQVNPRP